MKKIIILFLFLVLTGCATLKRPVSELILTPEERIQKYQEQISHYNFLIEQERNKIAIKANKEP